MSFRSIFTPPEGTAPVKKAAPAPRQAKVKPTQTNRRTNFASLYPDSAEITMLISHNPKAPGSAAAERFAGYKGAKTVGQARNNGVTYQDIANDLGRRFILVTDV